MPPSVGEASPLDGVLDAMGKLGYVCAPLHLDPMMFGFQMSRPRLWIPCVPERLLNGLQVDAFREAQSLAPTEFNKLTELIGRTPRHPKQS